MRIKNKGKGQLVIHNSGHGHLRELLRTILQSLSPNLNRVSQWSLYKRAGHLQEWLQGELRLYASN